MGFVTNAKANVYHSVINRKEPSGENSKTRLIANGAVKFRKRSRSVSSY